MPQRRVIVDVDEDNRITACKVYEGEQEVDMDMDEAITYLLDYTNIIQLAIELEDKIGREIEAQKKQSEFEYKKALYRLTSEIFDQADGLTIMRAFLAQPLLSFVGKIDNIECKNLFVTLLKRYVLPRIKNLIMVFIFGRRNAQEIDNFIKELREKYLGG